MPKHLAIVTGLFLAAFAALPLQAAELVMVQRPGCHWCLQWNEEIGVSYHKTEEARRAPLRRVEINALPDNIDFTSKPIFTPTFVLVEDGKELGRIEGYPGEHFFWPMLTQLLDAHPDATRPGGT